MPRKRPVDSLRETDLYAPVRDYLVAHGYAVRSEVLGCDIAAVKDGDLIVVELKRQLSLDLLVQATQRQRITASVYIAVPRPERIPWRRWQALQHVVKRLELGLILVTFGGNAPRVEIAFHPIPFTRRKQARRRRAVIEEMAGRSGDHNQGGSRGRKLMTAYRENALRIAWRLSALSPQRPRDLRALGTCEKTRAILYDNVYGWFERVDTGLYALSAAGRAALEEYAGIVAEFEA
jgi:hypothetical protein